MLNLRRHHPRLSLWWTTGHSTPTFDVYGPGGWTTTGKQKVDQPFGTIDTDFPFTVEASVNEHGVTATPRGSNARVRQPASPLLLC